MSNFPVISRRWSGKKAAIYLYRFYICIIQHPAFCPVLRLNLESVSLPEEISTRGVDVGASILLESSDGKILLSRRARHLRIFPGLWVPPGN